MTESRANDPVLSRPELRAFIAAAREQPLAKTEVSFEVVREGVERERGRRHRGRTVVLSAVVGLAAALAAVAVLWPVLSARQQARALEPLARHDTATAASSDDGVEGPGEARPSLASAIRLRSSESVEVRGPWSIAVGEGVHDIQVDRAVGHALTIELPDARTLELVEGHAIIEVVEHSAAVRLHAGVAAWVEGDQRTRISVEHIELDEGSGPASPAELARRAEAQLTAGKREAAIDLWRQLIRKYPQASQSRSALLDLARQLEQAGRRDHARCAYRLYLERWPDAPVKGEVTTRLRRLGKRRATCRGLDPLD